MRPVIHTEVMFYPHTLPIHNQINMPLKYYVTSPAVTSLLNTLQIKKAEGRKDIPHHKLMPVLYYNNPDFWIWV
jgi:hypothetical protein